MTGFGTSQEKAWGLGPWRALGVVALVGLWAGQGGASSDPVVMPSGLVSYLQEVIEEEGAVFRYRFVAPDFTNAGGLDVVTADLEHLCVQMVLPNLPERAGEGARIVVSLADAPSQFGVATPQITQVFEAFRVENGTCIWEVF